jgi:hypothetical protein
LTFGSVITGAAAIYFAVLNNNRLLGAQASFGKSANP